MILTDIGSIDEAEQVKQRHGWDDIEIDLPAELGFGLGVEGDEGVPIPSSRYVSRER
jgi:hypothetical protein